MSSRCCTPTRTLSALHRGPRTIGEVLAAASAAMDAEDERLERERDPVAWLHTRRRRRNLLGRLLYGR